MISQDTKNISGFSPEILGREGEDVLIFLCLPCFMKSVFFTCLVIFAHGERLWSHFPAGSITMVIGQLESPMCLP